MVDRGGAKMSLKNVRSELLSLKGTFITVTESL